MHFIQSIKAERGITGYRQRDLVHELAHQFGAPNHFCKLDSN